MSRLFLLPGTVKRDHEIELWMKVRDGDLGTLARAWFDVIRGCGDDVREIIHDGHPTACVGEAAFGYVNTFSSHVNVGFFNGARLADPSRLLSGTGKFMRHVKLRPGTDIEKTAMTELIKNAYIDMKELMKKGF